MKKVFAALLLVSSFSLFAATVQTSFKTTVRFNRADGKVKKLASVRLTTLHESDASLLRPSLIEECSITAGKYDFLSLLTDEDNYRCLGTKNTLVMSTEALQGIVDRSIAMSIFASNDLFDTLQNMVDNGKIESDAPGGAINSIINRLGRGVLGSGTTEIMRLDGTTKFKIQDERGLESFDIEMTIKKVEYLN
tara:strand:+ start:2202 stop:2780 length:579 start_codon:yes stop_codon:yes gene_type:complete